MRVPRYLLVFASVFMQQALAQAEALSTSVPFLGEPRREWIAVLDEQQLRLVKADVIKTPEALHLSAVFPGLPTEFKMAGVVEYEDGRVISNPLHEPERVNLPKESSHLARERIERLRRQEVDLQRQIQDLNAEADRLRRSLRLSAGLDDVDRVYDRVAQLEERLNELGVKPQE
jgi:hypothetical protein